MKYKKYYELNWTWHYINSSYTYSDYKVFSSEKELNEYRLKIFDDPCTEIVWCEKNISEVWSLT